MNWGSVSDWVIIGAGALSFASANIIAYALLRSSGKTNTINIKALQTEFQAIKNKEIALETLAACLDKATSQDKEFAELNRNSITRPMHDKMQEQCQSGMSSRMAVIEKDQNELSADIKEVKGALEEQNKKLTDVLVAIGTLTTKIDERTGQNRGTALDRHSRAIDGVNA